MRVLYVEEDAQKRLYYAQMLKKSGVKLFLSPFRHELLALYEKHMPDLLIIEVGPDYAKGLTLIKAIREIDQKLRIIIMSSCQEPSALQEAVELDISRYLFLPVSEEELASAITKAMTERHRDECTIRLQSNLIYQSNTRVLVHEDHEVVLNQKEARLLELLFEHKNTLLSYEQILTIIWPKTHASAASLRTLVKNLRKKGLADLIKNRSGSGYLLSV